MLTGKGVVVPGVEEAGETYMVAVACLAALGHGEATKSVS